MRFAYCALVVLAMLLSTLTFGSDEAGEAGKLPASVLAHDPEQGFKLAESALKRLGIVSQELTGNGPWEVPVSALVRVKRSIGVYRQVNGFLTFVLVERIPRAGATALIRSEDLRSGDHVVTEGGAFLRVIELDLSGGGGDSCG